MAIGLVLLVNKLLGQLRQFSEQRLEREFPTAGCVHDDPFDARPDNRGQRRRMNTGLTVLARRDSLASGERVTDFNEWLGK